jgi:glyoxylase-like metal-dependent hydrolase (beta-lactamase superfamily II)
MLTIQQFAVGGFDDNFSYIVAEDSSGRALIVDPAGDVEQLFTHLDERNLQLTGILITHTHFDHIEKLEQVLERSAVPVYVHESGATRIPDGEVQALTDMDTVSIGDSEVTVLHTPGHINDAVCYYMNAAHAADGVPHVITGDTLFVERVGKTNQRDVADLWESVQRLAQLPAETVVHPGHDYGSTAESTVARELKHNPYLTVSSFDAFREKRLGQ